MIYYYVSDTSSTLPGAPTWLNIPVAFDSYTNKVLEFTPTALPANHSAYQIWFWVADATKTKISAAATDHLFYHSVGYFDLDFEAKQKYTGCETHTNQNLVIQIQ